MWMLTGLLAMSISGCAGVGGSVQPPPPPPPPVTVLVSPSAVSVPLGGTSQFNAVVSNTTNTGVTWSVNGVPGGTSTAGTISASGLFTAPQNMPQAATVSVMATSLADPTATSTASATITSDIAVSVSPANANVELGANQIFAAHITSSGSPNAAVTWSLAGANCSNGSCGALDASGNYTAPQILPTAPSASVIARSVADPSKSGTSAITVTSHFTFSVSGPTTVDTGVTTNYAATLTPVVNSNPSTAISWAVSGAGCTGASCGSISASGATAGFIAPSVAPSPNIVTITATPVADPTKAASINVTIQGQITVAASPLTANVPLGATQGFLAQVTGSADTSVTWDVNGILGGNSTFGSVTNIPGTNTTTYTAPAAVPSPATVTVRATSHANTSVSNTASVTITSLASISLSPISATLAVNHRQMFTAGVSGNANTNVTWLVSGIAGGNASVGQICVVASNPCVVVTTASAGSVEYLAPSSVPTPNPVTLSAVSAANPSQTASVQITVLAHIVVSVSPASASLAPGGTQSFVANVLGTDNQSVTWNTTGTACVGVGSPCGGITSAGVFTAPISAPNPDLISIVATSSEDTSRTGSASVTIATTAAITGLLPASALSGSAGGFTLRVQGGNFVVSSPGPGSVIRVGGTARTTFCDTNGACTTTLDATDLASAGSVTVQMQNPDGTFSNIVNFVVAQDVATVDVIPLTLANPTVSARDIIVVESSTAGSPVPQADVALTVAAMGIFSVPNNSCTLGAAPVVLPRPASGTSIVDICVFSVSGLDPSMTFTVTGPGAADVAVVGKQPLGLGIIDLTLSVPSSAIAGLRSLLVQNANKDKAAATGALVVK
ncbi:MAG: hypothetical protein WAM91_09735 [Candidatus Acidiferrales bacterium]